MFPSHRKFRFIPELYCLINKTSRYRRTLFLMGGFVIIYLTFFRITFTHVALLCIVFLLIFLILDGTEPRLEHLHLGVALFPRDSLLRIFLFYFPQDL